jgi:hypothetical protein
VLGEQPEKAGENRHFQSLFVQQWMWKKKSKQIEWWKM